jgi:hypothetical protein
MFPVLKTLRLCSISLEDATYELTRAFNGNKLKSLTLRQCYGAEDFLHAIYDSGESRLTKLELVCRPDHPDIEEDLPNKLSVLFKAPSNSLKDLFISVSGPVETLWFWRHISQSRFPLTRFVYHQRATYEEPFLEGQLETRDRLGLIPHADLSELADSGSQHPFAELGLECLGISCLESILVRASSLLVNPLFSGPGNIK